ncbi:unnamed protein product [Peronospora destructor]|uniref:FYVE-type domain-containing protein n=1 Tax=Peronospora destructor TaxID=86335 RepID=A0AAV0UD13_9STRA|nr:unnamed protein product [Peronospora destructor]
MDQSLGNSEAVRLAQASDWKSLQRLLERDPSMAKQRGDHGMLPIHWACTVRRVPLSLVAKLLQAYPEGVQVKNGGQLLPLHIAIRARVQASCLRKLVRAYPEAVSERTPDGISALKMAQDIGLDVDCLKVLYRAQERTSLIQQHKGEHSSSCDRRNAEFELKRGMSEQEEGEAFGIKRPKNEDMEWTDAIVPEPVVGNTDFGGFLYVGDDGELDGVEKSALEPEDSISMMSEQSLLSDIDGLDTPHDHLVSPFSTSIGSQDDVKTPSSGLSFNTARLHSGSRRGLLEDQSHQKSQLKQKRMQDMASLLVQLQKDGVVSKRELRTMVLAMSADAAAGRNEEDEQSRTHSRHLSLPFMPSHKNFRQSLSFQFYNEADDEVEYDGNGNGSSRDSTSIEGGTAGTQVGSKDRLFHSARGLPRRAATRSGSQRGSPPLFRRSHRRASHGSNGRDHFDPAPEWKHDDECSICRASFGMFKHRHHCRNCGKSICSQHSADKKILMEDKGFTTPQRVCVTCYAMITHSRSLKHDLEFEDNVRDSSLLNPVAFQQHCAFSAGAGASDLYGADDASFPSSTAPLPNRNIPLGGSRSFTISDRSLSASPSSGHNGKSRNPGVLAAGESTGGAGERGTTNRVLRRSGAPSSAVHELRTLLASQQKQIEQLAQSNMQMQQQLFEQEELKAETMLLITQLMTRVSVLELKQDQSFRDSKHQSIGTGDSEDEEFPQDDISPFKR